MHESEGVEVRYITIHRINADCKESYHEFILLHGGDWIPVPLGDEKEGLYMLGFPPGTRAVEDLEYKRENRTRYYIYLPDEFYVVWYENTVVGTDKKNSTIAIPKQ